VIDRLNLEPLLKAYHIRGSSSYHPQMLLKVLVYGYVTNTCSSRKLASACQESVYMMWLSSMSYPDHNTINRFRGVRLKHALRMYSWMWSGCWQRRSAQYRGGEYGRDEDRGQCEQIYLCQDKAIQAIRKR